MPAGAYRELNPQRLLPALNAFRRAKPEMQPDYPG